MQNHIHRLIFAIIVSVTLPGCATLEGLHPVKNQAPAIPDGVYEAKDVDIHPQMKHPVAPRYPAELKIAGISGEALLMATVRVDGTVTDVIILKATDARFGTAAQEAMLKWQYRPASHKGQAVDCRITQLFQFTPWE